jgi:hypothetical protein
MQTEIIDFAHISHVQKVIQLYMRHIILVLEQLKINDDGHSSRELVYFYSSSFPYVIISRWTFTTQSLRKNEGNTGGPEKVEIRLKLFPQRHY